MAAVGLGRKKHQKPRTEILILLLLGTRSRFLQQLLQSEGYATAYASTAAHALALCVSSPIQAIVIDERLLASVDGWSVAQSVKMVKPALPVILFSDRRDAEAMTLPTAVDFVVSSAEIQQLTSVLRQCVRADRQRAAED
jgi:DNA-binding NtrC family response regulator